jgi:hypothetical protein
MCIRFSLQGVHRFELSRLSNMSNLLSCGSHHVDNLMEVMVVYGLLYYKTYITTLDWLSSCWQV